MTEPAITLPPDFTAMAKAAGFMLESWMTNPPKPAMWHGSPEAMRNLIEECARAATLAERERCALLAAEPPRIGIGAGGGGSTGDGWSAGGAAGHSLSGCANIGKTASD